MSLYAHVQQRMAVVALVSTSSSTGLQILTASYAQSLCQHVVLCVVVQHCEQFRTEPDSDVLKYTLQWWSLFIYSEAHEAFYLLVSTHVTTAISTGTTILLLLLLH
jgi:hypothetical protein